MSDTETKDESLEQEGISNTELIVHINSLLLDKGIDLVKRTIILESEFEEGVFTFVDTALSLLERDMEGEPITIRLLSYGGSVHQATGILGRILESPCEITISAYGCVASAATLILTCAKKRKMSRLAYFMYHGGSIEMPADRVVNQKDKLIQSEIEDTMWSQLMADHSNKSAKWWKKLSDNGKDHYFTAEKCLELGVIDEVF